MIAYLIKGKRREEVDVVYIGHLKQDWFKDVKTNSAYPASALKFKEYYGG